MSLCEVKTMYATKLSDAYGPIECEKVIRIKATLDAEAEHHLRGTVAGILRKTLALSHSVRMTMYVLIKLVAVKLRCPCRQQSADVTVLYAPERRWQGGDRGSLLAIRTSC